MRKFDLGFSEHRMEKEYSNLVESTNLQLIQGVSIFWVLAIAIFSIPLIYNGDILLGSIILSLVLLFGILLFFHQKIKKYHKYFLALLTAILGFGGIYLISYHQENNPSPLLQFARGWSFSAFQIILFSLFSQLKFTILIAILSFAARFIIMGTYTTKIFTLESVAGNILFDLIILYTFTILKHREKRTFEKLFWFQEELCTMKSYLNTCLPQSITILNSTATEAIYSNKAFFTFFPSSNEAPKSLMPPLEELTVEFEKNREIGTLFLSSTVPETMLSLKDYIGEAYKANLPGFQKTSILLSYQADKQNDKKMFEAKFAPFFWDQKKAYILTLTDVTLQEKIRILKKDDEKKDAMLATVSHELRTPLNNILGMLKVIEPKVSDPETNDFLYLCRDNADFLLSLVNSILDVQQIRTGTLKLNLSYVELSKLMSEIKRLFSFTVAQKKVYFKVEIDDDVPGFIYTDGNRLKQILINLISNALKFTLQGGITLHICEEPNDPEHLRFTVADTGIGIKNKFKSQMFKSFCKIDDPEGLNKGGVGLGLTIADALSKELREKDTGKGLFMESKYGVGTSFWFRILKTLDKDLEKEAGTPYFEVKKKNSLSPDKRTLSPNDSSFEVCESIEIEAGDYEESVKPKDIDIRLSNYSLRYRLNQSFWNESSLRVSNLADDATSRHLIEKTQTETQSPISRMRKSRTASYFKHTLEKRRTYDPNKDVVLIVDDNAFNLLLASNVVERLGYNVETVMDGESAIQRVKDLSQNPERFKLVLMDCQMPIMDGFEVSRILKEMMKKKEVCEVPIIALSASANQEINPKEFEDCGMSDFLSKPLLKEDFLRVISKLKG